MHRLALTLLATALIGVGVSTLAFAGADSSPATHYRWKDPAGVVHFGDTIPASALAGGYDVISSQGRVVRHVAPELTPSERRAAAAVESREAASRRASQQRKLTDAQMLSAYPTDEDLEQFQKAQLHQIQTDITALETNLQSQEDSLTELLAHAADLEHSGKPIPPYINERVAEQRQAVNNERGALAQRKADLATTTTKFAAQLEHYRALHAKFQNADDPPPP